MADFWDNPYEYPENWNEQLIHLYESQPNTHSSFYDNAADWYHAQDLFERAFIQEYDISRNERREAREEYWEWTGTDADQFDWEAWREYMDY